MADNNEQIFSKQIIDKTEKTLSPIITQKQEKFIKACNLYLSEYKKFVASIDAYRQLQRAKSRARHQLTGSASDQKINQLIETFNQSYNKEGQFQIETDHFFKELTNFHKSLIEYMGKELMTLYIYQDENEVLHTLQVPNIQDYLTYTSQNVKKRIKKSGEVSYSGGDLKAKIKQIQNSFNGPQMQQRVDQDKLKYLQSNYATYKNRYDTYGPYKNNAHVILANIGSWYVQIVNNLGDVKEAYAGLLAEILNNASFNIQEGQYGVYQLMVFVHKVDNSSGIFGADINIGNRMYSVKSQGASYYGFRKLFSQINTMLNDVTNLNSLIAKYGKGKTRNPIYDLSKDLDKIVKKIGEKTIDQIISNAGVKMT